MPGLSFECSCGKGHSVDIEHIAVGSGVYTKVFGLLKDYKDKKILLVADQNTYKVLGSDLFDLLKDDFSIKAVIFKEEHLRPDERAVGRLMLELDDTALILTVGSGTLNDISRFISGKLNIPYIIVGTAPSMDGYASSTSSLILQGVKFSSMRLVYPKAIIGDTDIMKNAPIHMLHAGLGDVIGKYTALSDWKLANRLKGEYFCFEVASLVEKAVEKCVASANELGIREESAVASVYEGLLLSGLAIGMIGHSRPAAGDEHNLAHCWEMIFLSRGTDIKWLHGNMVGVATGVLLDVNQYLSRLNIHSVLSSNKHLTFDKERWLKTMQEVYGKAVQN